MILFSFDIESNSYTKTPITVLNDYLYLKVLKEPHNHRLSLDILDNHIVVKPFNGQKYFISSKGYTDINSLERFFNISFVKSLNEDSILYFTPNTLYTNDLEFKRTKDKSKATTIVTPNFNHKDYRFITCYIFKDSITDSLYLIENTSLTAEPIQGDNFINWIQKEANYHAFQFINSSPELREIYFNKCANAEFVSKETMLRFNINLMFLVSTNPNSITSAITLKDLFAIHHPSPVSEEEFTSIFEGINSKDPQSILHAVNTILYSNVLSNPLQYKLLLDRAKWVLGNNFPSTNRVDLINKLLNQYERNTKK